MGTEIVKRDIKFGSTNLNESQAWERAHLIISKNLLIVHSLILHSNFEIRDDEELCKVIYLRDSLKKSIREMNLASTCYEQFCIEPRVKHVGGGHATTQDG